MKKLIVVMLLASAVIVSEDTFAQNSKCEKVLDAKSNVLSVSRGKDKNIIHGIIDGKRTFLKENATKSRGQSQKCMLSISNEYDVDVDVYVDGNYMGSLQSKRQGVVDEIDKYEKVYAVSVDKKRSWEQHGDCQCVYKFKFQK